MRLSDGQPLAVQQAYLPEHLVPGLIDRSEPIDSLHQVLADACGLLPTNATETYQPIRVGPDHARLLKARPGAPAFQVDRTTAVQYGRAIAFTTSIVRGDRYRLRLRLSRAPA